jgi:hypothetical protein
VSDALTRPTSVFVSYSRLDQKHLDRVEPFLQALEDAGNVSLFIDKHIETGEQWRRRILKALDRMDVAILLISDNFLNSEFIFEVELSNIRRAARNRDVMVIPLFLESCTADIPNWILEHQAPFDLETHLGAAEPSAADTTLSQMCERIKLFAFKDAIWPRLFRRRVANWRFSIPFATSVAAMSFVVFFISWRMIQPEPVRELTSGFPISMCQTDNNTSAVQLFENGWLAANFRRDEFYAIAKRPAAGVQWLRVDGAGFTKGVRDDCAGVENEHLLKLGFRWFYCRSGTAAEARALLGAPLSQEIRAWLQFQEWTTGLFVHGLPGTQQGVEQGSFQVLNGVMIAAPQNQKGTGRYFGYTVDTLETTEHCAAIWHAGQPSGGLAPGHAAYENDDRCGQLVRPDFYREARASCSVSGYP